MPGLRVEGLHVTRGGHAVLRGIDLELGEGRVGAVLGASGSGKSTLLRAIAGLERPDRGRVLLDGVDVTEWPPAQRDLGMVFQQAPLDPTRDVRANLRFPLWIRRVREDEIERRVLAEARAFSIAELLGRLPRQLSEGHRHAAAIARGVIRAPGLLLLDEPLADLDPAARGRSMIEIGTIQRGYGATLLLATNDPSVAAAMAEQVVVLDGGTVAQVGTYPDLYAAPATVAVAGLLGDPPMALLPGRVVRRPGRRPALVASGLERPTHDPAVAGLAPDAPLTLGVRAEDVRVDAADAHAIGVVRHVGLLGPDGLVELELVPRGVPTTPPAGPSGARLTARLPRPLPRVGDTAALRVDRVHVYDHHGRLVTVAR